MMANCNKSDYDFWPNCTCNRSCDAVSEASDDYYDYDNDSSYVDVDSEDECSSRERIFFISVYKSSILKNTIIISFAEEILTYRTKFAELRNKTESNVNNIWGDIIINTPLLGFAPLKIFIETLLRLPNKRKKQVKKPVPSMTLKKTSSDSSEKIGTRNTEKSKTQLMKIKENLNIENNSLNKVNIDKKVEEVKTNSTSQSEDKKTNVKIENKSGKHDIFWCMGNALVNPKSNVNKAGKNNSTLANNIEASVNKDQKANSINNIPSKINLENKNENKSDTINNSKNQTPVKNTKYNINEAQKSKSTTVDILKANICKDQTSNSIKNTPSKVNLENKNENKSTIKNEENKDKEKSNTVNQNSTPKKANIGNRNEDIKLSNGTLKNTNTPEKVVKINTPKQTNKNTNNLVNESKSPAVAEKFEKKVLANTPTKKTNSVDNNKQNAPEFKKPLDVKSTCNNTKNNMQEKVTDKASKKKLKKLKQKEKKMERNRTDSSNCSSVDTTEYTSSPDSMNKNINQSNKIISGGLKKTGKKKEENQVKNAAKNHLKNDTEESEIEKDDQSEYLRTSDDELDLLTDDDNLPAFLAKIKEKSKNKEKNNKVNAAVTTKINSNSTETKYLDDGKKEQEFIIHSKKRTKINRVIDQKSISCSQRLGENACQMILKNNFMGALEYLVDAIDFNYTEQRHFLNRCYCYLSMKKYDLALADAEYIINVSNNIGHLFIANVRAAQASYGLQRYDQAEAFMHEAIRLNPTNVYAARELILIQVARIVSMGFNEKDALLALEKFSTVKGAVNYLIENNINKLNYFKNEDLKISLDDCDEFVYSSDEDEPSNAEIVNRMTNYKPGTVKFQHVVAKPINAHILVSDTAKSTKKEKKVLLNGKANSEQNKAIWVGNLTSSITDAMLKKKFKEFGKVISVYHPLNETYAFINFEKAEDVTNVLTNTPCHELAGVKLLVRSAIRQK